MPNLVDLVLKISEILAIQCRLLINRYASEKTGRIPIFYFLKAKKVWISK